MKHVTQMTVWALVLAVVVAKGQNPATLTLEATGGEVTCIGFSSNGQAFFSGALDSYVSIWTTTDWKRSADIEPEPPPKAAAGEHQDEYRALAACAVEPNAVQAMIASGGDLISTYSLPGGKLVDSHRLPANDGSLAIDPDGSELAIGAGSKIVVLDARRWKEVGTLQIGARVGTLQYAPSGKILAVASQDGGIQLWETKRRTLVHTLSTSGNAGQMSFSPDGSLLAVARVGVWSTATGSEVTQLLGHNDNVWGVAFSPDGKFLVSSDTSGDLRIWKVAGWQHCLELRAAGGQQVAISPDGHWLAAGGGTQQISVWDFRNLLQSCR